MSQQQQTEDGLEFHPLFLPLDGQSTDDYKPEPIRIVRVFKIDRGTRYSLQAFSPDDPTSPRSEEDLVKLFGPGTYELVAHRHTGTIYARRQYHFLDPRGASPGVAPVAAGAPGMPAMMVDPVIMMFVQLMQKSSEDSRAMLMTMMQQQQQASQQQTQLLISAMGMQQSSGAQGQTALANVLGQVLSAKTVAAPSADPVKTAAQIFEFAKQFKSAESGTNWAELIAQLVAGLAAGAQAAQQSQQQPPQQHQPIIVETTSTPVPTNGAPSVPVA